MPHQNCWEFFACAREPNGARVCELGICPATTDTRCDGINGGKNGGRLCWCVTGTLCGGKVQGSFARKKMTCFECSFLQRVRQEQGNEFCLLKSSGELQEKELQNAE